MLKAAFGTTVAYLLAGTDAQNERETYSAERKKNRNA